MCSFLRLPLMEKKFITKLFYKLIVNKALDSDKIWHRKFLFCFSRKIVFSPLESKISRLLRAVSTENVKAQKRLSNADYDPLYDDSDPPSDDYNPDDYIYDEVLKNMSYR